MNIGLRIKCIRTKQKLSQEEFGMSLQSTRDTIVKIETGKQLPTISLLSEIVRIYHTTYNYLIDGITIYEPDSGEIFREEEPSLMLGKIIEQAKELGMLRYECEKLREENLFLKHEYKTQNLTQSVAEPEKRRYAKRK